METLQQLSTFPLVMDILRMCLWLLLIMLIFLPLERLFPQRRQKIFRKDFLTDLGYFFLSGLLPKLILSAPIALAAGLLHDLVPQWIHAQTAGLPVVGRVVLALIVSDFGAYWAHRWLHEIPFLWRFHAIHHSPEEIDWLVNTRAHPIDLAFPRFCGFMLMYVFGLTQPMANTVDWIAALVLVVGTLWGFFIHSNLRWRFGWLEWIISTPAFHHWHHTNDGAEYVNKNYAAMFPWIDKLFGTCYLPKRQWPTRYGLDEVVPPNLLAQLVAPFGLYRKR
ncbi:MAG: sterol desaturase family protein [Sedimenticola sp.]